MSDKNTSQIMDVIGRVPYRIALAGGWIDQPFMSMHNPSAPGSMVVVSVVPEFRFMDRAGICGSTRSVAMEMWGDQVPDGEYDDLVRRLYEAENKGKADPSGSQDMIGIIYPGINRIDYDYAHEGGVFARHVESNNDPETARWLQEHLYVLAVNMRPDGYSPLGRRNLRPEWVARLGKSGRSCFEAIVNRELKGLGQSLNECMRCWHVLLPDVLEHPSIGINLVSILKHYQDNYAGAMYSGCGGGYLYVVSDREVPGGFKVRIRMAGE